MLPIQSRHISLLVDWLLLWTCTWCSPCLVQAPSKFTMLRWGPKWLMIFSSDIRAWVSLRLAVAEERVRKTKRVRDAWKVEQEKWADWNQETFCPCQIVQRPIGWNSNQAGNQTKAQQAAALSVLTGIQHWYHSVWQLRRGLYCAHFIVHTNTHMAFCCVFHCMSYISAFSLPLLCWTVNEWDRMQ